MPSRTPPPTPSMSQAERRGRILLAAALALLFVVVFISTLAGRILWVGILPAVALGLGGGALFAIGKRID